MAAPPKRARATRRPPRHLHRRALRRGPRPRGCDRHPTRRRPAARAREARLGRPRRRRPRPLAVVAGDAARAALVALEGQVELRPHRRAAQARARRGRRGGGGGPRRADGRRRPLHRRRVARARSARTHAASPTIWVDARADANDAVHLAVDALPRHAGGPRHGVDGGRSAARLRLVPVGGLPRRGAARVRGAARRRRRGGAALRASSCHVWTMRDVDRLGIAGAIERAVRAVDPHGVRPLHLSLDIDAVDPHFAPGTGTCARGGLTYREAHYICEAARARPPRDLVAVNPLATAACARGCTPATRARCRCSPTVDGALTSAFGVGASAAASRPALETSCAYAMPGRLPPEESRALTLFIEQAGRPAARCGQPRHARRARRRRGRRTAQVLPALVGERSGERDRWCQQRVGAQKVPAAARGARTRTIRRQTRGGLGARAGDQVRHGARAGDKSERACRRVARAPDSAAMRASRRWQRCTLTG